MRITVACPEALMAEANHLAMALAFSEADAETYRDPVWQDDAGNRYAAASFEVRAQWVGAATAPPTRPDWDVDEIIDIQAAARAQAVLDFWAADRDDQPPSARPDRMVAIAALDGLAALAAMGLVAIANRA